MVKRNIFIILILISTSLYARSSNEIYDLNCEQCHSKLPVTIDKFFYRYLLKYSSETMVKKSMFEYLKNPTKEKTIMPESFVTRFGIKKKSNLSDIKLREAIDSYWDEYKIFEKLK